MKWKTIKLGDISIVSSSKRIFARQYVESGVPFYRQKEIICKKNKVDISESLFISKDTYDEIKIKFGVPQKGDLLITAVGTLGIPYIVGDEVFYFKDGNLIWLRDFDNQINSKYIYYWITSDFGQKLIWTRTIGSAQPALTIDTIKQFELPVPPIEVQNKIASILSAYDDLIENNRKQIKLLEEASQRLYKEWFVDLHFPNYENVPVIDGVPKGWKIVKITELLDIKYGKDHKSLKNGEVPTYGSGGIMRKVNSVLYSGESVLIPRKGSLNNILLVSGDFWTIDTMFYSVPKKENVIKYCYLALSQIDMYSMNIGSAVPSMTTKILDGIKILLPSESVLLAFNQIVSKHFDMIKVLCKQNEKLKEARDRLLPKLMSGELEV